MVCFIFQEMFVNDKKNCMRVHVNAIFPVVTLNYCKYVGKYHISYPLTFWVKFY